MRCMDQTYLADHVLAGRPDHGFALSRVLRDQSRDIAPGQASSVSCSAGPAGGSETVARPGRKKYRQKIQAEPAVALTVDGGPARDLYATGAICLERLLSSRLAERRKRRLGVGSSGRSQVTGWRKRWNTCRRATLSDK